jgi:membrane protease YdiL (CAAX protease family)
MAPATIKLNTVAFSLAVILATEGLAWWIVGRSLLSPLAVVGLVRLFQISMLCWAAVKWEGGLRAIGWSPGSWRAGLKKGAQWSIGFGAAAAVAMLAIYMAGYNPLGLIKSPLPSTSLELGLFFFVGGLIAPVAEEICFRGMIYTFFRRWGAIAALVVSTAIFAGLHIPQGIPVTQIVGGIVFAIAYETSGNLMVPITIHCLGNLSIFTLSLL